MRDLFHHQLSSTCPENGTGFHRCSAVYWRNSRSRRRSRSSSSSSSSSRSSSSSSSSRRDGGGGDLLKIQKIHHSPIIHHLKNQTSSPLLSPFFWWLKTQPFPWLPRGVNREFPDLPPTDRPEPRSPKKALKLLHPKSSTAWQAVQRGLPPFSSGFWFQGKTWIFHPHKKSGGERKEGSICLVNEVCGGVVGCGVVLGCVERGVFSFLIVTIYIYR